jgi:leucyl aminopeptidase
VRTLILVAALASCAGKSDHLYVQTADGVKEMSEPEIDALAERIHADEHHCGGFFVLDDPADVATRPERPIEYTLDRAEIVRAVLPQLDERKIVGTIRELSAMPNRYFQSASGAAASGWLRDRWRSFTTRSDVTVELVDHGWAQKSVVMTIPGSTGVRRVRRGRGRAAR